MTDDLPVDEGVLTPPIEDDDPIAEIVFDCSSTERRRLELALQGEIDATYQLTPLRTSPDVVVHTLEVVDGGEPRARELAEVGDQQRELPEFTTARALGGTDD